MKLLLITIPMKLILIAIILSLSACSSGQWAGALNGLADSTQSTGVKCESYNQNGRTYTECN